MFVTKKGSNLRRPTGKMRDTILVPARNNNKKTVNDESLDLTNMKESCKRKVKEASKKSDKNDVTE